MTELEIAKKALNAISVCENNPDTDRRACWKVIRAFISEKYANYFGI